MLFQRRMPVTGFYHICTINHWRDVVKEQVSVMRRSGLYDFCDRIVVGKVGEESLAPLPQKFVLGYESSDIQEYEFPTLKMLHQHCQTKPGVVFYVHTKGVRYKQEWECFRPVCEWRWAMNFFNLGRWRRCWKGLHKRDVCGILWRWSGRGFPGNDFPEDFDLDNAKHFAGNFWWARNDYIRRLPVPDYQSRGMGEFWIGLKNPRVQGFNLMLQGPGVENLSWDQYYPIHL